MTGRGNGGINNSETAGPEPSLAEVLARLGALEAALTSAVEKLPGLEAVNRVAETLEKLPAAIAQQAAAMSSPPAEPEESAWLTVTQAAERGRLSTCFIYRMIAQGRLHVEGRRKCYRIWLKHFDEQLALGWPVLNAPDPVEAMRQSRRAAGGGARIPRPKRPTMFNNPSPKLV